MFKKHIFAAAAVGSCLWANPAHAAKITYLECNVPAGEEIILWKLALDEAAQTVSWEHPFASGTDRAIFSSEKVSWKRGRFQISRVTLQFSRENFLGGGTDTGQCKVVNPPKRAF
jgi:hypothetical protein